MPTLLAPIYTEKFDKERLFMYKLIFQLRPNAGKNGLRLRGKNLNNYIKYLL